MTELIIIKLGGSVITDKSKSKGTFRKSVVARLAEEIKKAGKVKKFRLIIIHGAGSFGHPIAKKYNLNKGYVGLNSAVGVAKCRAAMAELKQLMVQTLNDGKVLSDIVDTSSVVVTNGDEIAEFNLEKINYLLKLNIVPVLSGDVVIDERKGISILSGDSIAPYLAKKLGAKLIIFVSDVDGVYDKNPNKNKEAKLIPEVSMQNYKEIIRSFERSNNADVTGEMKNKVLEILKHKDLKANVVSGFRIGSVKSVLLGKKMGTLIHS